MECAADAHGGELILINKFRQRQLVPGEEMGAETGNNTHYRRMARLEPEGEIQLFAGGRY